MSERVQFVTIPYPTGTDGTLSDAGLRRSFTSSVWIRSLQRWEYYHDVTKALTSVSYSKTPFDCARHRRSFENRFARLLRRQRGLSGAETVKEAKKDDRIRCSAFKFHFDWSGEFELSKCEIAPAIPQDRIVKYAINTLHAIHPECRPWNGHSEILEMLTDRWNSWCAGSSHEQRNPLLWRILTGGSNVRTGDHKKCADRSQEKEQYRYR